MENYKTKGEDALQARINLIKKTEDTNIALDTFIKEIETGVESQIADTAIHTKEYEDLTTNMNTTVTNNTELIKSALQIFTESLVSAISGIDGAVESAKNFANQAEAAAARRSKTDDLLKVFGFKATGGSVDQNGMYYLHRGENVTNPVDSSFSNSSGGGSGGDIIINMNNSTFGDFSQWKAKMDDYFSQQMRHMR